MNRNMRREVNKIKQARQILDSLLLPPDQQATLQAAQAATHRLYEAVRDKPSAAERREVIEL